MFTEIFKMSWLFEIDSFGRAKELNLYTAINNPIGESSEASDKEDYEKEGSDSGVVARKSSQNFELKLDGSTHGKVILNEALHVARLDSGTCVVQG